MASSSERDELRAPTVQVFPAAARMPAVGLGTWTQHGLGEVSESVEAAIRIGYRHIDCAAEYQNEGEVGQALSRVLRDGTVRREELWLTSKLDNPDHAADRVEAACRESLQRLGVDYLDLLLIHWPLTAVPQTGELDPPLEVTWAAMEGLVRKGLVRAIGTSNFSIKKLQRLLASGAIRPAVNQVEAHPYFRNQPLVEWCQAQGIHVTAYSPLGTPHTTHFFRREGVPSLMEASGDATLRGIAEKHGRAPAEVLVAWALQRGTSCLPKSRQEAHMRSNLAAASWRLPDGDFQALSSLPFQRRMLDGAWCLSPQGPYKTLEDLWDTEQEERTSHK